jgi:hypothetical protein
VDPVPDPLLLRKTGSAGNRTQVSQMTYCIQILHVKCLLCVSHMTLACPCLPPNVDLDNLPNKHIIDSTTMLRTCLHEWNATSSTVPLSEDGKETGSSHPIATFCSYIQGECIAMAGGC